LDETSLAEDAVLERLNSVLEPSRLLVRAEKGSDVSLDSLEDLCPVNFRILKSKPIMIFKFMQKCLTMLNGLIKQHVVALNQLLPISYYHLERCFPGDILF